MTFEFIENIVQPSSSLSRHNSQDPNISLLPSFLPRVSSAPASAFQPYSNLHNSNFSPTLPTHHPSTHSQPLCSHVHQPALENGTCGSIFSLRTL
eukprot:c33754_g1_i1 orf=101-385(+)